MLKALRDWLSDRREPPGPTPPPAGAQAFAQLNRNAPLRAGTATGEDSAAASLSYLCREAVLGRDQHVAGYQFMLHEGTRGNIRNSSRRIHHVYAEVLVRNLIHADIGRLLGHRLAFIQVPDSFLAHPCLADLPAGNVVLEIMPHPDPGAPAPEALVETVRGLRQAGFRIGLPNPQAVPEHAALLPQADVVVARAPTLDALRHVELGRLIAASAPNARLLVRDLPALEDFRFAYKMGGALFQGPFITSREDWSEGELSPDTLRIAALIKHLREDADTRKIAALIKQDAALALRLLRYINSAANALPEPIQSIEHALLILGRAPLQRWLILLNCGTAQRGGRSAAALEAALIRARMMELLAARRAPAEREELFLVGLLSLADVIMRAPLGKILAQLALAPAIRTALLNAEGPLYPLLELAIATENGHADAQRVRCAAERCGVAPHQASIRHLEAVMWAMELQA
ncbi:HDOD domain-containing protein [Pseudothauera nasutitermitis]|uniref:HDOD domain-containing protein n=1 Tax=Pseudothauera nasutitermitis TaxID=2565930 RepID=A0A4V3WCF0_9RHOO|nr:HDOD domain-containing protein [Pseudothauera nasutitermitis]THF66944.1 HDOD domain-containing protein [Pseudothauera nasutitermitis]